MDSPLTQYVVDGDVKKLIKMFKGTTYQTWWEGSWHENDRRKLLERAFQGYDDALDHGDERFPYIAIIDLLMKHGAIPNADQIFRACTDSALLAMLLNGGHERWLHELRDSGGNTILHDATNYEPSEETEMVMEHLIPTLRELLNVKNINGQTPLYDARPDEAIRMLELGANPTFAGPNLIHSAVTRLNPQLALLLFSHRLKANSNIKIRRDNKTPLHYAMLRNYTLDMVRMLIEAGADVNAQDRFGMPPIVTLVAEGWTLEIASTARFLLEHGANIGVKDTRGESLLDTVVLGNATPQRIELANLLLQYGDWIYVADEDTIDDKFKNILTRERMLHMLKTQAPRVEADNPRREVLPPEMFQAMTGFLKVPKKL